MADTPPVPRKKSKLKAGLRSIGKIFLCGVDISPDSIEQALEKASPTNTSIEKDTDTTTPAASCTSDDPSLTMVRAPLKKRSESRTSLKKRMNSGKPIEQLPPEIMAEIFAMAVLSEAASTSSRMTPFKLGKVCSRWRGIAWSTAHIWSSVYLRLSRRRYQAQAALLRAWLDRSGRYSLTIHLTLEDEGAWTHAAPQKVVAILASESKRWYSVNFVLPEACYPRLEIAKGNLPVLTSFILQPLLSDCRRSQANRKRLTAFENAPELRTAHLNGYYLDDTIVPWGQLLQLTTQHVYLDECFYALLRVPKITYVCFSTILLNDTGRVVVKSPIKLPHMEYLKMHGASGADQAILLAEMTLPCLSELDLSSPDTSRVLSSIPALLTRSGCLLKKFTLSSCQLVEDELVECLSGMPSIEELKLAPLLTGPPLSSLLMNTLAGYTRNADQNPDSYKGAFLPRLQHLEYEGLASFDGAAVEMMLGYRRRRSGEGPPAIANLKSLRIITDSDINANREVKKNLQKMADEGLVLVIKSLGGTSWL